MPGVGSSWGFRRGDSDGRIGTCMVMKAPAEGMAYFYMKNRADNVRPCPRRHRLAGIGFIHRIEHGTGRRKTSTCCSIWATRSRAHHLRTRDAAAIDVRAVVVKNYRENRVPIHSQRLHVGPGYSSPLVVSTHAYGGR